MLHKTGCISILSTVVLILLMEDATLTSACPKGLKRFKQAHKARLAENAAKAKAFKKTQDSLHIVT
uniref:60S ribosomal protein L29 n=1 Tax=Macrostomum lignano TaxID=282301 RepID=A0A1I8GNM7_9PLAT